QGLPVGRGLHHRLAGNDHCLLRGADRAGRPRMGCGDRGLCTKPGDHRQSRHAVSGAWHHRGH
ncbi:hypothetical protein PHISP_08839, partial [Aspergillus sp. HF37]